MDIKVSIVILAGGKSSRMGDLCKYIPKCLIKFNNKPFLGYLIDYLSKYSFVDEIILSTGHLAFEIQEFVSNQTFVNSKIKLVKEEYLLGTGGGLRKSVNFCSNNTIFVCNSDTIVEIDLEQIFQTYLLHSYNSLTVVSLNQDLPNQGAILVLNNKVVYCLEGKIRIDNFLSRTFDYRSSSTGCYFFSRELIIEFLNPEINYSLEHYFLDLLITHNLLYAYSIDNNFVWDFGTPERALYLYQNEHKILEVYGDYDYKS